MTFNCMVTKEEDELLSKSGLRSDMGYSDDIKFMDINDPWRRYRLAGLYNEILVIDWGPPTYSKKVFYPKPKLIGPLNDNE